MSDPNPIPNNNLQPHAEDTEDDAELLAGEPGDAEARNDTGEGFGPLPGDEDDDHA
jgi:hypothetical protein